MTKIKLNPAFEEFRGKMAGIVYRIRYGKQTGSKAPDMSKVKWSPAQEEHRRRFRLAVAYACPAISNEKVPVVYVEQKASVRSIWQFRIISRGGIC